MTIPLGTPGIVGATRHVNYAVHYGAPSPHARLRFQVRANTALTYDRPNPKSKTLTLRIAFLRRLSSLLDWILATAKQIMFLNESFPYEMQARYVRGIHV